MEDISPSRSKTFSELRRRTRRKRQLRVMRCMWPRRKQETKGLKRRERNINVRNLRVLRGEIVFLVREVRHDASGNLRKPRKLSTIVVHAFPQTALGKRGSPVGEQPKP